MIDIDVVWVSDIRFEEISDFFEHTPYMRDYTRYNKYWTRIDGVTVPFTMKSGKLEIENYSLDRAYELFLERKDWDDSASIYEEVYR